MSQDEVTITHPTLGEAVVVASALPVWTERGWTPVEPTDSDASPARRAKKATGHQ